MAVSRWAAPQRPALVLAKASERKCGHWLNHQLLPQLEAGLMAQGTLQSKPCGTFYHIVTTSYNQSACIQTWTILVLLRVDTPPSPLQALPRADVVLAQGTLR